MVYVRADRSQLTVYTSEDADVLGKFLFKRYKHINSGLALCLLTISTHVEKILSAGTDVAGMQSKH